MIAINECGLFPKAKMITSSSTRATIRKIGKLGISDIHKNDETMDTNSKVSQSALDFHAAKNCILDESKR